MPVAKYVYACFLLGFLKYPEKSQTCRTLSLTYTAGTFFVVEWFKNAARLRFVHCNVKSKSVFPFFFLCVLQAVRCHHSLLAASQNPAPTLL